MDNGTLMLNGLDYSGGQGTLVVNGVVYSGAGGGEKSSEFGVNIVYNPASAGSSTYTIEEDGYYMISVGYCHSGYGSITLPSDRTPVIDESYISTISGGNRGSLLKLVKLYAGDAVSISFGYTGQWSGAYGFIAKTNGFEDYVVYSKNYADDEETRPNVPNDDTTYIALGFTSGRSYSESWSKVNPYDSDSTITAQINLNSTMFCWKGKGSEYPSVREYGFNGGLVRCFVLSKQ